MAKKIAADDPLDVTYCIPLWVRDEQIKINIEKVKARIEPVQDSIPDPIAVVCFGPSLNDTWEQIKDFQYIITCSGAHKFLVERGIIPTYHCEVDPREHKIQLIGTPQKKTQYLISSTCHPKLLDFLKDYDVRLWHVFDNKAEAVRVLPPGEWALTGGSSVGLRAMTIARFLGFKNLHIFGMDGSQGPSGKHAAEHPNQPKAEYEYEYPEGSGNIYITTPSMLACAKQTWHELDHMPDVKATFYGEGLVQAMAKDYVPNPIAKEKEVIGVKKEETISEEYRELNRQLFRDNVAYGVGGGKHAPIVLKLAESINSTSILDYGCGRGYLAKAIPFPIWEYDPAVEGKEESPRPADLVVCTDVLEHIEPDKLDAVLADLQRCVQKIGYFVIHTGKSTKFLADGRNAHLIQKGEAWWRKKLTKFFDLKPNSIIVKSPLLYVVLAPKSQKGKK